MERSDSQDVKSCFIRVYVCQEAKPTLNHQHFEWCLVSITLQTTAAIMDIYDTFP